MKRSINATFKELDNGIFIQNEDKWLHVISEHGEVKPNTLTNNLVQAPTDNPYIWLYTYTCNKTNQTGFVARVKMTDIIGPLCLGKGGSTDVKSNAIHRLETMLNNRSAKRR